MIISSFSGNAATTYSKPKSGLSDRREGSVVGKVPASEQGKTSKATVLGVEEALEINEGAASIEKPVAGGSEDGSGIGWLWRMASS
jgi:hypothetical protein